MGFTLGPSRNPVDGCQLSPHGHQGEAGGHAANLTGRAQAGQHAIHELFPQPLDGGCQLLPLPNQGFDKGGKRGAVVFRR